MELDRAQSSGRFNPRACVRRDKSATPSMYALVGFQSTRLREARLPTSSTSGSVSMFQSTRLREARPLAAARCLGLASFNPRACVRRDKRSP